MSNDTYQENKRLKQENENLRGALRVKAETDALPKMIEGCMIAFLGGNAEFHVSVCGQPTYGIRFLVDKPPAPPRQPSDASHL